MCQTNTPCMSRAPGARTAAARQLRLREFSRLIYDWLSLARRNPRRVFLFCRTAQLAIHSGLLVGLETPPPSASVARPAPIPRPPPPPREPLPSRSPLPEPRCRVGPCFGISRSGGTGSRSSAARMKSRRETTSSCVWTRRPPTSSRAARSARRIWSSVPRRMTSESAASTASRMPRTI